jgi:pyridoxine 4-dehydrogenase
LREVVESGISHIDTSDDYGPFVTNALIKEALYPYHESLHLVTKVGGSPRPRRGDGSRPVHPRTCAGAVHDNLEHLGLEALDVVNLRMGGFGSPDGGSLAQPFEALAELQRDRD